MSWDELVVVLFITSRTLFTLPRRIWEGVRTDLDPSIAAVAVLLILLSVALLGVERLLRRRTG